MAFNGKTHLVFNIPIAAKNNGRSHGIVKVTQIVTRLNRCQQFVSPMNLTMSSLVKSKNLAFSRK